MSARGQILFGMPGPLNPQTQASERLAEEAISHLAKAIEAARNSNQAGENAVVRAARAIGFRRNPVPNYCKPCGEFVLPEQRACPFCFRATTPADEL